MSAPPSSYTRLQKLVWTMRQHGNEADTLDLNRLAQFNSWTDADELLVEFKIQANGSRKLPEELAVTAPKTIPTEEVTDE